MRLEGENDPLSRSPVHAEHDALCRHDEGLAGDDPEASRFDASFQGEAPRSGAARSRHELGLDAVPPALGFPRALGGSPLLEETRGAVQDDLAPAAVHVQIAPPVEAAR